MKSDWVFIDSRRIRSKNRLTPPPKVRDIVVGSFIFDRKCVWWNYDQDTGLAVISNTDQSSFVSFGRSSLDIDNVVTPDAGLVQATFPSLEEGDCLIFLGRDDLITGEERHVYIIHEDQMYDIIPDTSNISNYIP